MTSSHIVLAVVAAVLVFWIVGAYNRLVSLRGNVAKCFGPVESQLRRRDTLLQTWLDTLRPLLQLTGPLTLPGMLDQALRSIDAVTAACGQLRAALDMLCPKPLAAAPAATVRLAEATLADARQRLRLELPAELLERPGVDLALATEGLGAADAALQFDRGRFNEASDAYNIARRQFPTWLIAALFGFRPAGTL